MANVRPTFVSLLHMFGAILLAFGTELNKQSLWVFLAPALTGICIISVSWGMKCRKKKQLYPSKKYLALYLPLGSVLVMIGLVSDTRSIIGKGENVHMLELHKTNKYFFSPFSPFPAPQQHLLDLLRFPLNKAELFHRAFNMAHGDGTEYFMFIAKTESFRDKMLAKGHDLSLGLRQLVQFGLNFGILIRNLMIVNCFVHGRRADRRRNIKARRG